MATNKKVEEAERLIDDFAAQLLALNDGKAIPIQWKNYLLKAIKPSPAKRGVKRDYEQVTKVVKQLTLAGDKVRRSRTKHFNPAIIKDAIAKAFGISRKSVERIDDDRPEGMSELDRLDHLGDPQLRKAYIDGIADAIYEALTEELRKEDVIESKARELAMHRRFPSEE